MDSHSRSASPRDQPRPQQRPPSPPSPRLPPAAFDNKAYQHDDADPNHNESFTSNGAQQNGHNKEPNGESKSLEAVNLELINLTPKNGSLKQKKDVEVDMNGSNPYDEYFVPVNEHRKYMRGEKLYVTADKRGEKGGCKRPLCWTLLALVVAAIIALIALAATGVIFSNSPTPVDPYNVSISSARALGGIGQSHDDHVNDHDQDQHNHNHDQQNEQHDHSNDQNQDQHDQNQEHAHHILDHDQNEHIPDQNQEQPNQNQESPNHKQEQPEHVHDQEQNEHSYDENQPQQGQGELEHEHHEPVLDQDQDQDKNHDQDRGQHEYSLDQDHEQHDQSRDHNHEQLDQSQNSDQHNQMNQQQNPEVHVPDTHDEGRDHAFVLGISNMSMYVPRTVEGELKIDNEQFLEAYNDPESDEYQQFTESFKEALMRALFDRNTLEAGLNEIKLEVIQLRPGSVIVTYRINWKPKYEDRPTEDLLNATTLEEKLNNYLINNNRMVSIYHVAEDNLTTRAVLDLCQINKNDCQEGCEFDETSLNFICTCPRGLILDMNNLKTCVPYLSYPASKPIQENSSDVNKATLITTTAKAVNPQVVENNSGNDGKVIEAETTTEVESDLKFSSPFDEHIKHRWDLESTIEHNQQVNEGPESVTKQSPEMKISVITESEGRVHSASEMNSTISQLDAQTTTNYGIYSKDGSISESHEEKVEPTKPELDQEDKEENISGQHMHLDFNSNNVTEANTDFKPSQYETSSSSYDSEPEVQEGHYSDSAFNLNEALESHQVVKPEEVYTEEPESTLLPSEENESKEVSHSIIEPEQNVMTESNETLVSSEISNPSTTYAVSEPHASAEIISDKSIQTSAATTTTANPTTTTISQQDLNSIKDPSQEQNLEVISHEKDISKDLSETNIDSDISKTETNSDNIDDWLTDTIPIDNKTSITTTSENSEPDTNFVSQNVTEFENNTESRSFESSYNGSETTTIPTSNNIVDMNTLLNILSADNNTTKDKEAKTEYNPGEMTEDAEIGKSGLDKKDYFDENRNNTNLDDEKKQVDYDISSIISESKVPTLHETDPSEQEITTELSENSSKIMSHMSQDFLNAMESLDEPQVNKTLTNTNITDDAKYVTFEDINMLLNRSSKSMDNLTQNTDSKEFFETKDNKTTDLENIPPKQNNSEWISESVTEVKYNEGVNTMDKTETTESVKNKVDHIMNHAKDDYEPDYLSKADDSMYMMERDYESEDPRVKRVNTENRDVTIAEFPKEKNTETNSILNAAITTTSEPISTNLPPTVVINIATSTTSVPSTTVSEFIYNTAEKNSNVLNETSAETTTVPNTSSTPSILESVLVSKESNMESNSESIPTASNETSLGSMETTTSIVFAPHTHNNETLNNIEVSNNNKQNETQVSNLDVTIYEISHHIGNHSLPVSKSTNTPMSEYEDHETEMNPFLPETENNKNLVKKLQEGHDIELTNMNETQNDNSDEHNSTERHIMNMVNNETSAKTPTVNEQMNMTTPAYDKTVFETRGNDRTSLDNSEISESSNSNKVIQEDKDNNVEKGQEVLPISTFLIDTDDLDANKISSSSNSFTHSPLSRFRDSNNENLSVVPIDRDIEEENAPLKNSKTQRRYELNDISDTSKNSEKRTFELANFDTFTNNES